MLPLYFAFILAFTNFIFTNCVMLVKVVLDLQPIQRVLCVKQEYTLAGSPVHHRHHTHTLSHTLLTPRGSFAQSACFSGRWKEVCELKRKLERIVNHYFLLQVNNSKRNFRRRKRSNSWVDWGRMIPVATCRFSFIWVYFVRRIHEPRSYEPTEI